MFTFLTGFIASIAHVTTGPDHLAAVTPLAIDSRKKSWLVGLSWGIGHTLGMLLIGLLFILFKEFLPIEALSEYSELLIGIMLIFIGSWAIFRSYRKHSHNHSTHTHFHTQPYIYAHVHHHSHPVSVSLPQDHVHKHEHGWVHTHDHEDIQTGTIHKNAFTALSIGVVHGFAGFSHLFALLPSLALPSVWAAVIYISAFALGTIFTMTLFGFILGLVAFQSLVKDKQVFLKWFTLSGGVFAILVGIVWIWTGIAGL